MAEALFDAFHFTEVLGVETTGWVKVKMASGYSASIPASDAFAVKGAPGAMVTRGSTGEVRASDTIYAAGSHTFLNYGPFFVDPFNIGCNWMWYGGDDRTLGFGEGYNGGFQSCTTGTYPNAHTWAWYGRGGVAGCDGYTTKSIASPLVGDSSHIDVICLRPTAYSAWDTDEFGPWTLYLYAEDEDSACKPKLAHSNNPDGFGSVETMPTSGCHKMAEDLFDAFQFTEVLGVETTGWVKVKMADGAPIPASDAFATRGTPGAMVTRGSTGEVRASDTIYAAGSHTFLNYGPFFVDPFNIGCNWMWYGGDDRTLGFGEGYSSKFSSCTSGAHPTAHTWAWYGRGGVAGCDA